MSKGLVWELDIEKWQEISIESYQFVIEQAKERFDEVINESKAILSQGMKILLETYQAIQINIRSFIGPCGHVYIRCIQKIL